MILEIAWRQMLLNETIFWTTSIVNEKNQLKLSFNLTELFPPERIQIQERTHPNESIVDVSLRNIQNQILLSTEIELTSSLHTETVSHNYHFVTMLVTSF